MSLKTKWKNQYQYIESASNFHNRIRDLFITDSMFKNMNCYQEVPVVDLIRDYSNRLHRFDWYVEEFDMVIELHGMQHYKRVNFGNVSYEQSARDFKDIKRRDTMKRLAALDSGLEYKEIHYKHAHKSLTYIKQLILK
jgi:hypothetical protein